MGVAKYKGYACELERIDVCGIQQCKSATTRSKIYEEI